MNRPQFNELQNKFYIEKLIEQYGKVLMNFAYTYVKDWGLAEDIMQEVFISVYKNGQIDQVASPKSWLYAITANKSKDLLRKKYLKKDVLVGIREYFWKSDERTPENTVIGASKNSMISKQILNLPLKYREVIILYYYEDLSIKEIGELLEQKNATVKSKLHRGREMLKRKLETEASDWFE